MKNMESYCIDNKKKNDFKTITPLGDYSYNN